MVSSKTQTYQSPEALKEAKQRLIEWERKISLQKGLPFLYGWKWYTWAREFFESTEKLNFLCAANQISKSSTQIRKCIDWATNQTKWPLLWRETPKQFWYLYPTSAQASIEFETKWKQFLPSGEYKEHTSYGWKAEFKGREIFAIHFNSGVHVYFKTYAQDAQALQTGTVDAIFCDEELPEELYDELIFRVSASEGYFHMVFTATLGQDFWKQVMEPASKKDERLREARKWTVSMFDCQKYEDGTPSPWTTEKINMVMGRCKNDYEIQKRVYGRFIMDEGARKYEQFEIKRHMKEPHPLPPGWVVYGGVDVGSGGLQGHKSAIIFVAVRPDFQQGRVFLGWRGDGVSTTASDVVTKYGELKKRYNLKPVAQFYDWSCRDFFEIAARMGEPFQPAEKSHEKGEEILNVLFKNDMLFVYATDELQKLASELVNLLNTTPKNKSKDDFCDALRYAVTRIPWDWSAIGSGAGAKDNFTTTEKPLNARESELAERRKHFEAQSAESARIEEEFNEWNDLYG